MFSEPVQNFRKIFIDDSSGFTQDTLHSRVLTSPLHRRWFYKPNNLAKYQYFYTRDFISLRHLKKWRSPWQTFFETSTFYHISTIFKSE